jgi:small subunit ribosomal protein S34
MNRINSSIPKAFAKLMPEQATQFDSTTTIFPHPTTLFRTLSRLPRDGVGSRVAQRRWDAKGIHGSYWEVTKTKLKLSEDGKMAHGKAWGRLIWKGMSRNEHKV